MQLCPICGTPLERHKEKDRIIRVCPVCGYQTESVGPTKNVSTGITFKPKEKPESDIIEERRYRGALSEITSCPKCGHSPVYYTFLQTRAADEPPVRLYRCPKCGYSWREYS